MDSYVNETKARLRFGFVLSEMNMNMSTISLQI